MRATRPWADAVRLAVGTLTAVPVEPPERMDPEVTGRAMLLAPLVGVIPGLLAVAVCAVGGGAGLSAGVRAALVLLATALVTRGIHLDGLADAADGLAASFHRPRALEVMRRGDIGPAGTAALVLCLLVQFAALDQVIGRRGAGAVLVVPVLVAPVLGRLAVPLACRRGVTAARPEGLGAQVAGTVPVRWLGLVTAICVLWAAGALAVAGDRWWSGLAAGVLAVAAAGALVRHCVRRFGGVTGDVIGAAVEAATAVVLLALAVG